MTEDLFSSLGLTLVNPTTNVGGLRRLKQNDEQQFIAYIPRIPGCNQDPVIQYRQHYFSRLQKTVRCNGGACCIKAQESDAARERLPESEKAKVRSAKAQTRYMFPVLLYTGTSMSNYGAPVELRYMDVSWSVFNEWQEGRELVNNEIAPYFERDFILTKSNINGTSMVVPKLTACESRAKWLTDPAINAMVQELLSKEGLLKEYVDKVPKQYTEEEFNAMWEASKPAMTAAQTAIMQQANQTAGLSQPIVQQPIVQPIQPMQVQPVQPVQPLGQQPMQVAYTPQNIIAGTYNNTSPVVTAESAINQAPSVSAEQVLQATTPVAQTPIQTTPAAPAEATAPSVSQTEVDLSSIGDLDAIIASLPQV